jgi:hypothetical protein
MLENIFKTPEIRRITCDGYVVVESTTVRTADEIYTAWVLPGRKITRDYSVVWDYVKWIKDNNYHRLGAWALREVA